MLKREDEHLMFDDRLLMLFGVPVVGVVVHLLFFSASWKEYWASCPEEFIEGIAYTLPFWMVFRALIIRIRKRYSEHYSSKRICLTVAGVVVLTPIVQMVVTLIVMSIRNVLGLEDSLVPTFARALFATYFVVITILLFYESVYFFQKYKIALVEKEQLKQMHVQSQLDNLRNQINPHFLFNSLNTLMNLIADDGDRAMQYLSKLSKFYRYTVSRKDDQLVPLATELDNLQIYTDLLRERFQEGIQVHLPQSIPQTALVLPLCLQLLVENAVKHNVVAPDRPLLVEVMIKEKGSKIVVRNNIQEKIEEVRSTGMGLGNIRERVALVTQQQIEVSSLDGVFQVSLPLVYASKNDPFTS